MAITQIILLTMIGYLIVIRRVIGLDARGSYHQFIENHFVETHCLNYLNHFVKITLLSASMVLLLMASKPQGLPGPLDWTEVVVKGWGRLSLFRL
jgi:hypothetical protein